MAHFQNRPFVLLGVNSDSSKSVVQEVRRKGIVTWRSWMDGSTEGPIHRAWDISAWPSYRLIDHKGILRDVSFPVKIENLEELVRAAEESSPNEDEPPGR